MDSTPNNDKPVICKHCRSVSPVGSYYCNLCGNPVSGEFSGEAQAVKFPSPSEIPPTVTYEHLKPKKSKTAAVLASIGLFIFLTPVLLGVGAFGGCLAAAFTGSEMLFAPGMILGVLASLWICWMTYKSMAN